MGITFWRNFLGVTPSGGSLRFVLASQLLRDTAGRFMSTRRSQPDRAARGAALQHLGEPRAPGAAFKTLRDNRSIRQMETEPDKGIGPSSRGFWRTSRK